jgi:hypothetical protein
VRKLLSTVPAAAKSTIDATLEWLGIPPRSRLCPLEVKGTNTPMIEGLASYVPCLATEHNVTPGVLVAQELAHWADIPLTKHRAHSTAAESLYFSFFAAHGLNGWGPATEGLVAALELCTQTEGMGETTLLRFQSALCAESLFCPFNRWCLLCLREWQLYRIRVCEPLIWSLGAISVCYEHRVLLEDRCNDCKLQPGVLRSRSAPWSCSQCRKPIVAVESVVAPQQLPADAPAVRRAQQIGALLVGTMTRGHIDISSCLKANLQTCVDKLANGNVSEFKRLCGLSAGKLLGFPDCRPRLDQLLMICERFDLVLSSLFDPDLRLSSRAATVIITEPIERSNRNPSTDRANGMLRNVLEGSPAESVGEVLRRAKSDLEQRAPVAASSSTRPLQSSRARYVIDNPSMKRSVEMHLESSLRSESVESVRQIAKELGFESPPALKREFAELCMAIAKKNDALMQRYWLEIETRLTEALLEEPPPTLKAVCTRLHVRPKFVRRKFPILGSKIVERSQLEALAVVERRRSKLTALFPVAHLMTLQDLLKEMDCSCATLITQCPEQYGEIRKLVRNPRTEAGALRAARLDNLVLEQLKRDLKNGRGTTVASIQATLPQDALRGSNAVRAALHRARGW